MTHLFVDLFDRVNAKFPCCTLNDHEVSNRQYFHNLHRRGVADRAARVVVKPGDEYRPGDHIRLLDQARPSYADTVAIDPLIAADVDLNTILFNEHGFAERPEAILIVANPNLDSSFRLRLSLYAQVGQRLPSLVLYDWECPPETGLADLECFHFAHQAAFIRVERGPAYRAGDRVILRETPAAEGQSYALEPGDYDLIELRFEPGWSGEVWLVGARKSWAEAVTAIELALQPQVVRQ